jgi:high-affinity nickel-transport protein
MFGLDERIASLSDGTTLLVVAVVAILLGFRHATDPDHLTAVTTLVAGKRGTRPRRAGALGLAWGLGHATTLFAFGVPIVLYRAFLPAPLQEAAEAAVGVVIVVLAVSLLVRWYRGGFAHSVGDHTRRVRTPLQAFAIGLVHGTGGSAGVGVLLLAAIPSHPLAIAALALFAACTAVSMASVSTGFGMALARASALRAFAAAVPVLGLASLAFGTWYALGALNLAPYYF